MPATLTRCLGYTQPKRTGKDIGVCGEDGRSGVNVNFKKDRNMSLDCRGSSLVLLTSRVWRRGNSFHSLGVQEHLPLLRAALGWAICLGSVLTIRTRYNDTKEIEVPSWYS